MLNTVVTRYEILKHEDPSSLADNISHLIESNERDLKGYWDVNGAPFQATEHADGNPNSKKIKYFYQSMKYLKYQ